MNRKKLLEAARAAGFTGKTLDELKAWMESDGIGDFTHNGEKVDVAKAWNTTATLVTEDDNKQPEKKTPEQLTEERKARGDVKSEVEKVDHKGMGGYSGRFAAARKAYQKTIDAGTSSWQDVDDAELFAAQSRLTIAGPTGDYPFKKHDLEIVGKTMTTTGATGGSAYVPVDYVPEVIRLREVYGVARQISRVVEMTRDAQEYPNETGDITVVYAGENGTITPSDMAAVPINLRAHKMSALTKVTNELFNDAAVSVSDRLAASAMYKLDLALDQEFFNGDGTATYGGAEGVRQNLKGLSGTIANIAGLKVATGNAYSEIVIEDFDDLDGLLPAAYEQNAVWVMHKRFWSGVAAKRWRAAYGGALPSEISPMATKSSFYDKKVIISQVMPRVEGNSQVCCLLGDFQRGSMIGIVKGSMRFERSEHFYFDSDSIAIRVNWRVGHNSAFGVGNASATEASREPGPIVGLITAAS